jgi:AbrB family looped-hinge helix DNA binding protein
MAHLPGLLPKITSKGQITIPLSIHNRFGLQPGADVETDTGRIGT